jgi:hypothetical protein
MCFPFTSPFLSSFIPYNFYHAVLRPSNFKSRLATYIRKLKCIILQLDFEAMRVSKIHSPGTGVCLYGYAYSAWLWFELVCINYVKISSLCAKNTVVLTVISLLRKDIGEIVNMWKTVV